MTFYHSTVVIISLALSSLSSSVQQRRSSFFGHQGRHTRLPLIWHQPAHREYTTILDDIDISHLLQTDSPDASPMGSRLDLNIAHSVAHSTDTSGKRAGRHRGARFALPPVGAIAGVGGVGLPHQRSATPPPVSVSSVLKPRSLRATPVAAQDVNPDFHNFCDKQKPHRHPQNLHHPRLSPSRTSSGDLTHAKAESKAF